MATAEDNEALWAAEGLLDPAAPDADERRELLRYLTDLGATVDDLHWARREGQLPGLAGELVRRSRRLLTARDVAAEAGVDVETVLRVSRVAGLPTRDPDEPTYREDDAAAFRLFAAAIGFFGEQATIEFTRSVGAALATIADSAMAVFGINVAGRFDERGTSQIERARAIRFASLQLMDGVPNVLETLFFHHVDAAVRRTLASSGEAAHTVHSAVGFVDLVRSTALVQELSPDDLAAAIGGFEQQAVEIIAGRNGRVVKTIGDEVMFVVPDPGAACDAALALREAVAADPRLPAVRGAISVGELVRGYGDFYGTEVTKAARAVKAAEPGMLLATAEVRDHAPDSLRFESIGARTLRGFDDPVELFALSRA